MVVASESGMDEIDASAPETTVLGPGSPARPWQALPGWAVFVLAGAAWWLVGFLPWIVEGLHVDSSSAWPNFYTVDTPRVALPFGEYQFPALLTSSIIGGVAALAVARLGAATVARPRLLAAGGAIVAMTVALGQTLLTVTPGLASMFEARLLVLALAVAAIASALLGVLVGAAFAGRRGVAWLLAGALLASFTGPWFTDLVHRGPAVDQPWTELVARTYPGISGVVLGLVLGAYGARPARRRLGWLSAVVIAWAIPVGLSLLAYVTYAVTRGPLRQSVITDLAHSLRGELHYWLTPTVRIVGPLVLAVVIGAVLSGMRVSRANDHPS
ncbi:hypothetical protein N803_12050 [Knoellia subterranea KCTC 19937]|uniref:Uncharacterized protein n=2 Tax=Knoellia TaxID=136099 RepID=A0A0A0JLZ2_9MICO|nr:hypothetical protein N803_12050 [Knoellia subterranea KCTC 19937]